MSKLNTEFFIARRLSVVGGGDSRNVMVRIASATVSIGVAVMIISLAVISGFKSQITDKLIGFGSHIQIVNLDGNYSLETIPIDRNEALVEQVAAVVGVESVSAYAIKGGIVKTDQAMQGVMLKGVERGYDSLFFAEGLVDGQLPLVGADAREKSILLSRNLTDMLQLKVDDKVEMLFIQGDKPPRRDRFKVCGIYQTGYKELDDMVVLTDIRNVQRLNGWDESQVTGYEVMANSLSELESVDPQVYNIVQGHSSAESQLMSLNLRERFPMLFDWLQTHNVNAAVVITIMLVVALLNMISALLIILFERTSMIGTLKALGMNDRSIQKVFVIRSSFIVLRGVVWGNVIGIGLVLVQYFTDVVKLDQSGYFLESVPVDPDIWMILAVNVGTLVTIVGVLTIPAMIISYMKPDKTIRFQ